MLTIKECLIKKHTIKESGNWEESTEKERWNGKIGQSLKEFGKTI